MRIQTVSDSLFTAIDMNTFLKSMAAQHILEAKVPQPEMATAVRVELAVVCSPPPGFIWALQEPDW